MASLTLTPSSTLAEAVFGKTENSLREWFGCLYQVLLGQDEGPRMGSFIRLYGLDETRALIAEALSGALAAGPAEGAQG